MKKPKSDYSIQTVSNALRLLEVFREDAEIGVTELSRRLGLHKNNVFRLLATLEQAGYIEQSAASERYRLGTRCLELGQAFSRGHPLLRRARPVLESLAGELQETVHLGVLRDFEVVHLDAQEPDQLVLTTSRVGRRLPAHCTALGKVLVGCADAATQQAYDRDFVSRGRLQAATEHTIVDPLKLFEHLRGVMAEGVALDLEECAPGLCCAAAPVQDAAGQVRAAISVSGPAFRLGQESLRERVVPLLTAAAGRLSQDLGAPR
ncbi:MAG: IclR family transcriptional regulator [Proteobacteria bacterium]|nr:IclR family transcriptional regulator [Pseudomonadota bacterium]